MNLIDSYGKQGVKLNLLKRPANIIDTEYLSRYFVLSEFNPKFTAGKNSISINGSPYLKNNSEILIECIDFAGNNLYIEMAKGTGNIAYRESNSYVVSIHVYNDISNGIGKLILYGTTLDSQNVRWVGNISIDKTLKNISTVRFYQTPKITVNSILTPVLGTDQSNTIKSTIEFDGKSIGLAVNPPVRTTLSSINLSNIDLDYEIIVVNPTISRSTSDSGSFNSQMDGATIILDLNKIQNPSTNQSITPNPSTQSFSIKKTINNKTLQLTTPFSYPDNNKNFLVANISDADFSIIYPYIGYNNSTASYLTSVIGGENITIKKSYADVIYDNIRTFSGYVARHKVYRKSLLSNEDFSVIADEPVTANELLKDNLTLNKYYERLGVFYNDQHINHYWFTSSADLSLVYTPDVYINSVKIDASDYNLIDGKKYVIVKNDSVNIQRNATYIPYNQSEYVYTSGSSYDSNFIPIRANTNYIFSLNAIIDKNTNDDSYVKFFFTSSVPNASKENNFTNDFGIKLAELMVSHGVSSKRFDSQLFFFYPQNDLYGTIVIVPYKCKITLYDMSFRVYGDDGFSPDTFTTRIPWPIEIANESYEIKAELFDVNSRLIYSNLNTIQNFDASGSSLIPFVPSGTSGSLVVSQSIIVQHGDIIIEQGVIYDPNMLYRNKITQSRIMAWNGTDRAVGEITKTTIIDVNHNDQWLFVTTGSTTDETDTGPIKTRRSIASEYGGSYGRKYYWIGDTRVEEIN
jgi:hypothetical protein